MTNRARMTASVSSVMANGGRPSGGSTSASATAIQISRVAPRIRLCLLAEQAARTHHEDGQHDQENESKREIGSVVVAEHLDEADHHPADQRAQETAQAAADDDPEDVSDDGRPHPL